VGTIYFQVNCIYVGHDLLLLIIKTKKSMTLVDSPVLAVKDNTKTKNLNGSPTVSRILKSIKITSKEKVLIEFTKRVTMPATGEEDSVDHDIVIKVKSPHRPHKDFESAIKKLKKHALALFELEVTNDKDFSVVSQFEKRFFLKLPLFLPHFGSTFAAFFVLITYLSIRLLLNINLL
jgi:hypothetical protein